MTANQLRVGNYLYYHIKDDLDERKEWDEINAVDAEDILAISDGRGEYLIPIPLTGDWLEKFGFKSIDKQSNLFYSSKLIRITLPTSRCTSGVCYVSVRGCKVFNNENYFRAGINLKIKYVHQLQNLYFVLTGKELKIK